MIFGSKAHPLVDQAQHFLNIGNAEAAQDTIDNFLSSASRKCSKRSQAYEIKSAAQQAIARNNRAQAQHSDTVAQTPAQGADKSTPPPYGSDEFDVRTPTPTSEPAKKTPVRTPTPPSPVLASSSAQRTASPAPVVNETHPVRNAAITATAAAAGAAVGAFAANRVSHPSAPAQTSYNRPSAQTSYTGPSTYRPGLSTLGVRRPLVYNSGYVGGGFNNGFMAQDMAFQEDMQAMNLQMDANMLAMQGDTGAAMMLDQQAMNDRIVADELRFGNNPMMMDMAIQQDVLAADMNMNLDMDMGMMNFDNGFNNGFGF